MSDDRTIRIGPDPQRPGSARRPGRPGGPDARRNAVIGTTVAVVLAAIVLGFFVARGGRDDEEQAAPLVSESALATEPTAPSSAPASPPTDQGTPPAAPAAPSDAAPTAPPSPTDRPPTSGDVTAFLDAYEAEHGDGTQTRLVDIDGDGVQEIVAARVADDTAQIDVAAWDGATFVVGFTDSGGAADRIEDLVLADVNLQDGIELVTYQAIGAQGSSISVWGLGTSDPFARQNAQGGCWDGGHTFGITGVIIETGRIEASCDGSPLPPEAWPRDVYEWQQGSTGEAGWTYVETLESQ